MSLTIVMYHYVRPIGAGRFFNLKGLDVGRFRAQLKHIAAHFTPVTMAQVKRAATDGPPLPDNAALLTFDDGYSDHLRHALPLLLEHGMQGAFFPPAGAVIQRRVLDVNKIHFVLALGGDPAVLVERVDTEVAARAAELPLSLAAYRAAHYAPSRFDDAAITYVKKMLQTVLPLAVRSAIVDELFRAHVTSDETAFADELYLSVDDLRAMEDAGMHVGGHGGTHRRLSHLTDTELDDEIADTAGLLGRLRQSDGARTFCYPYGDYDARVAARIAQAGFSLAFTTKVAVADLDRDPALELPRLDTNDLPQQ